jgi:hypothetical protein
MADNRLQNAAVPQAGSARFVRVAGATLLALVLAGCSSQFDVTNPNQLGQADLDRPEAALALVNGAEATATRALAQLLFPLEAASDDIVSIGSYDASRELDQGYLANPSNEFVTSAFASLSEARFMADEAIRQLTAFDSAGTLPGRAGLARAYLYGGIVYTAIGDGFSDFVISDRRTASPPIGAANMRQVYDTAVVYLDRGLVVARAAGNADLALAILAQRARARHARALWTLLRDAGTAGAPASPLVRDAAASEDAVAALALLRQPDWKLRFTYSPTTVSNLLASWVNVRQEFRATDELAIPTADNKKVASIRLLDPIDGRPDVVLRAIVDEFVADLQYPPLTVVSARELRLIVAEVALATGDSVAAVAQLNAVRALNARAPYLGQLSLLDLLRHERRVGLFLQGRRLADQYRFGVQDTRWLPASDARRAPGTRLSIPETERRSNCYISGRCGTTAR